VKGLPAFCGSLTRLAEVRNPLVIPSAIDDAATVDDLAAAVALLPRPDWELYDTGVAVMHIAAPWTSPTAWPPRRPVPPRVVGPDRHEPTSGGRAPRSAAI
jgi:hypothetical protein